jgi:putative two-component system response regulator
MKTIFVVDDIDTNLSVAESALEDHYYVLTVPSAIKMFVLLEKIKPDLILLDVEMPQMNGFEALEKLKNDSRWADISVMFLTDRNDPVVEARGFEMGAIGFVGKPFSTPVLLNRIKTHLNIDDIIAERTARLQHVQNAIIPVLADMVENRDKGTGGHIERTSKYMKILIDGMKLRGVYVDEIAKWDIEQLVVSARMHDLGKVYVTDKIVNKPGKLEHDEFELMKTHALMGEKIIDDMGQRTGEKEFFNNAKLFAVSHHERWDGNGYPYGLKGEEIPLQGRIMAVVDVYDALVSERPYKKAFSDEEAIKIITEGSGAHYDPKIVEVFLDIKELFKEVRSNL